MAPEPLLGLGATALDAWLTEHDKTAKWLAQQVGVSGATVHDWLHAGWLDGGAVPDAFHRRRIEIATSGDVRQDLFAQDDERRREHRRAARGRRRPSDPAPVPEAS